MARSNKARARKANKNQTKGQSQLSMQQEARNTEGRNLWCSNVQLRHQMVHFVSAGSLEPVYEPRLDSLVEAVPTKEESTDEMVSESVTSKAYDDRLDSNPASQIIKTTSPNAPILPRSRTAGDSSEDEIVFKGRRRKPVLDPCNSPLNTHVDEKIPIGEQDEAYTMRCSSASTIYEERELSSWIPVGGTAAKAHPEASDEDEILADYIAHMADDSDDNGITEDDEPTANHSQGSARDSEEVDSNESSSEELDDDTIYVLANPSQSARRKPEKTIFASATAFADALEQDPYYGLDVMDFSRSSLKKNKSKNKKFIDHPGFDGLDSELEDGLVNTWNNDRLKKKMKKREREELRAQGLLGRRRNDPDLKIKYADDINIEELKSEIRLFLLSPKNSLSLPPMTKHRRILVHDMAHALHLSSQSRGKGSSRFPVLSKTSRTPKYTNKTISQLDRVFSKERFSSRALKAWDKASGRSGKIKRGKGNVSYMDGDVVGASAPEIGAENKGRAMLEKMGWSTGTALGAANNKGILLPVAHVVKNSKAGLGGDRV
ncbi:putative R3H and G-patch domain protein [Aspergillus foveolatus]|uniref:putative R3H and G-patch domain protein n=1 Tax=Aspergillus foveolatus TaxID=210207 RepID=UPI003CCDAED4